MNKPRMRKAIKKRRMRRPGAGRKPLGKKRVMYKLMPETIEAVKKRASELGISRSEYVEGAVRKELERR